MSRLRMLTTILLLLPIAPLLGWGFVTHAWINRKALRKARQTAGSSLPKALTAWYWRRKFETYGALPDAISAHTLTSKDRTFDPLHNCNPCNHLGTPAFGFELLRHARADREIRFACGWTAHQLADATAHYGGYCEGLPTFGCLFPENEGDQAAKRRAGAARPVLKDMDHGITEMLVDIMSAAQGRRLAGNRWLHMCDALIHAAWPAVAPEAGSIEHKWLKMFLLFRNGVLPTEVKLAYHLKHARCDGKPIVRVLEEHYEGPNGYVAPWGSLSAWRDQAAENVAKFLLDPQVNPLESQPERPVVDTALPTTETIGLPSDGGGLRYKLSRYVSAARTWMGVNLIALVFPWWRDNLAFLQLDRTLDSLPAPDKRSLMWCIVHPLVDGLRDGLGLDETIRGVVRGLPPLVDVSTVTPAPGSTISAGDAGRGECGFDLVDVAQDIASGDSSTQAEERLVIGAVRLDGEAMNPSPTITTKWLPEEGAWKVSWAIGQPLAAGEHEIQVEGDVKAPSGDKLFRYEWEITAK